MFFSQSFIGAVLICVTVIIHAIFLDVLIRWIGNASNAAHLTFKRHWKPLMPFCFGRVHRTYRTNMAVGYILFMG